MPKKRKKKKAKKSFFSRFLKKTQRDDDIFEEEDDVNLLDREYDDIEDMDIDDEIEDEMFENDTPLTPASTSDDELRINLIDANDTLVAQAVVPGLEEDEIDIDLNREMLTITTKSNERCTEQHGDYLYEELSFGSFSRSVLLPAEIEVEDSTAEVKDGLLTIVMPKINRAMKKKLQIKRRR